MKLLVWGALGGAWSAVVFATTFWYFFPSTDVASFLAYQVRERTAGAYALQVGGVSPWWLGVTVDDVMLSKVDPAEGLVPVFLGEQLGARVGPWTTMLGTPRFFAFLKLGEGRLDATVDLRYVDGGVGARRVELEGDDLPVDELLTLAGLGAVGATGVVDVSAKLGLAAGLDKARGDVSLEGRGLTLDTITVEALGWEDRELGATVDELDIRLQIDDGKGEVARGLLASSLAKVELDGEVEFAEALDRSRLDLGLLVELKDWEGSPLESYRSLVEGYLGTARWSDGSYHYEIDTVVGRLDGSDIRPVRERSRAVPSRSVGEVEASPTEPTPTPRPGFPSRGADRWGDLDEGTRVAPPEPPPEPEEDDLDDEELLDDDELEDEEEPVDGEEELDEIGY